MNVPENVPARQIRQQEFGNYRDFIGMDITSVVTLPVWIMEPYTMLQKVAEIMEYTELLDRAATTEDDFERLSLYIIISCKILPATLAQIERVCQGFDDTGLQNLF